ncbi:MAG: hypothetical protein ACXVCD_04490 [Pseudobdellovibrionaceae bacterium]
MLIIATLVVSSISQAIVADRFKCSLEIKDLGSKASTKEEKDFFIARLPMSASPAQDVRLTASQTMETLTLNTPKAEFGANLNFYYKHAVKVDANGNAVEARQFTCIGLSGHYCDKSGKGGKDGYQICDSGIVGCIGPKNPFDPNNGWSPTGLVGGEPTFNEQTLGPVTSNISDDGGNRVGVVNLNCQYLGSFQ